MKKKILATISVFALLSAAIAALVLNACSGGGSSSSGVISAGTMTVLNPTVTGPIAAPDRPAPGATTSPATRNFNFFSSQFDLAARGYVEEEYFISGTATRFNIPTGSAATTTATIRDDGHPYKSRIVVRKPSDPTKFSGTVIVEWFNVTNNMDMEYCWYEIYDYVMRKGHVWVGVSAQRVGVNALISWSTPTTASATNSPTATNRYSTLDVSHLKDGTALTSDALHFDIFSQAIQALKHPVGVNPLAGLTPTTFIAMGQSQSAVMLSSYVNNVHPLAKVADAFALESTYGTNIRKDLISPVWKVLTENDVVTFSEANYRRPDDNMFVTWEVPNASHNDYRAWVSRVFLEHRDMNNIAVEDSLACTYMPVGSKVPFYHVLSAGLEQLITWAHGGAPIVSAPPLTVVQFTPAVVVDRDPLGMTKGGIRLPQVQVPALNSSGNNSGPGTCTRWGYYMDYPTTTLNDTYATHASYVNLVTLATNSVLNSKYILPEDATQDIADATAAVIPPNGH